MYFYKKYGKSICTFIKKVHMKWIRQKYMYFYKKSTYEMDTAKVYVLL
jgi:hypothetical protein